MKKGVSIIALAIYIIGFITIIGLLVAFNVNILTKTNDFVVRNTLNTEYIKFNMFVTTITKQNNYIMPDVDANGNNILKIFNYDKLLQTEYARDEESGEQYISAKYWENDSGEEIGYIIYDSTSKCIYYIKYDNINSKYDIDNPIVISNYVTKAEFNVNSENSNVDIHLEYEANDTSFVPNDITYIMGRGY